VSKKLGLLSLWVGAILISGCGQHTAKKVTNGEWKPDTSSYKTRACNQTLRFGKEFSAQARIDKIVVYKGKRTLTTYRNGQVVNSFKMSLGKNADKGNKVQTGDYRTPEGSYKIVRKKCDNRLYRSLMISYPNANDRARARAAGVQPGGYITIHGQPKWNADGRGDKYTLSHDWTEGCMAVPNKAMDILWRAVKNGVEVEIHS